MDKGPNECAQLAGLKVPDPHPARGTVRLNDCPHPSIAGDRQSGRAHIEAESEWNAAQLPLRPQIPHHEARPIMPDDRVSVRRDYERAGHPSETGLPLAVRDKPDRDRLRLSDEERLARRVKRQSHPVPVTLPDLPDLAGHEAPEQHEAAPFRGGELTPVRGDCDRGDVAPVPDQRHQLDLPKFAGYPHLQTPSAASML